LPFVFGNYILDGERRELRRAGDLVVLEPGVFDLLVHLIRNRDHVVSKDELIASVWGGRIVSESTLTSRINGARKAIGDSGARQERIRTISRKGIRFVAEVSQVATVLPERPALPLPEKPSIAVLAFDNLSGDPGQDYFADGMVEEIITALSRFHWLFVIARNSSFTYKGRAVDVKKISRELGVRYVMEGSVRKAGPKVRITGQLLDGISGAHLWSDRFDGTLEDIFELQDQVAMSVVGAIEPKLRQAEIERARRKPTESLDAYDHLLRAYAEPVTREGNERAIAHLDQALALDPHYAAAAGYAAWQYLRRRHRGWTVDVEEEAREGCRLARLVADGNRSDPLAMAHAAYATAQLGRDYDASLALIDIALKLNPNGFQICNYAGWMRLHVGDVPQAITLLHRALRLNPLDPLVCNTLAGLANAHWLVGEYDESLELARRAVLANRNYPFGHIAVIIALASMERMDEARAAVGELLKVDPTHSVSRWQKAQAYRNPATQEARMEVLRKAGLPE
jgi:TolB-like protein